MITTVRIAAPAALACALLVGSPSRAQTAPSAAAPSDPATWGIYTRLAGTTRQDSVGFTMTWHWQEPGRVLIEEYRRPGASKASQTASITPGPTPGTLVLNASTVLGKKLWNGTVQPDGSVVYLGTGMLKMNYKAVLADDGAYEIRLIKVQDGKAVSIADANPAMTYRPSATDAAASAAATAPVPTSATPSVLPAATPRTAPPAEPARANVLAANEPPHAAAGRPPSAAAPAAVDVSTHAKPVHTIEPNAPDVSAQPAARATQATAMNTSTPTNGRYTREGGAAWFQLYDTGASLTYMDEETVYKCPKKDKGTYICEPWDTDAYVLQYEDDHSVVTFNQADMTPKRWITDARPPEAPTDPAEVARLLKEQKDREAADLQHLVQERADLERRVQAVQDQDEQYAAAEAARKEQEIVAAAEKRKSEQELQDSIQRLNDSTAQSQAVAKRLTAPQQSGAPASASAKTSRAGARDIPGGYIEIEDRPDAASATNPQVVARPNEARPQGNGRAQSPFGTGGNAASQDCKVAKRTVFPSRGQGDSREAAEADARDHADRACGTSGVADYGLAGSCTQQVGINGDRYWMCTPRVECNATETRCANRPSEASGQ